MDRRSAKVLLREFLREQVCSVGRVAARYAISDDALWEIAKEFDCRYQQFRQRLERRPPEVATPRLLRWLKPHPGLIYLLDRLDREATVEDKMRTGRDKGRQATRRALLPMQQGRGGTASPSRRR